MNHRPHDIRGERACYELGAPNTFSPARRDDGWRQIVHLPPRPAFYATIWRARLRAWVRQSASVLSSAPNK